VEEVVEEAEEEEEEEKEQGEEGEVGKEGEGEEGEVVGRSKRRKTRDGKNDVHIPKKKLMSAENMLEAIEHANLPKPGTRSVRALNSGNDRFRESQVGVVLQPGQPQPPLLKYVISLQGEVDQEFQALPISLQPFWHAFHYQLLPAFILARGGVVANEMCACALLAPCHPPPMHQPLLAWPLPHPRRSSHSRVSATKQSGGTRRSGTFRLVLTEQGLQVSSLARLCSPDTTRP